MSRVRLVYGVGINDASYLVQPTINGKQVMCPFYRKWKGMLERCYSEKFRDKRPTYGDCYVCDEWFTFSNFKTWMETQDWEGKELDKDLLFQGNKEYSPETCIFVSKQVNLFMTETKVSKGACPTGVHWEGRRDAPYIAQIGLLGRGTRRRIGEFTTEEEAEEAYKKAKAELAVELAGQQTDQRVSLAILARYKP